MLQQFVILCIAALISFVSILLVLFVTRRYKLYDQIDERKVHTGNIPRLGGIGIFIGFVSGLIILNVIDGRQNYLGNRMWFLIAGCSIIFVMGVSDDLKPWRARYKLVAQCIAAVLVIAAGFNFHHISFGPTGLNWTLGFLRYPLTFFWILGVTNALNLIDGIDGLAGSVSTMAALSYAVFFFWYDNYGAMLVCLLLAFSISGFLFFNLPFPKAKIFMGDGGSQFLGYMLAILPLINNGDGKPAIALPYAFGVLIVPIFDTFAAIWRRVREHRRIDSPDRLHLHHKLMLLGFSTRQSLVIVIVFQLIIGLLVTCSVALGGTFALIILFTVYLIGILFFTVIHIRKEQALAVLEEDAGV